jgi:hypothetical protein
VGDGWTTGLIEDGGRRQVTLLARVERRRAVVGDSGPPRSQRGGDGGVAGSKWTLCLRVESGRVFEAATVTWPGQSRLSALVLRAREW